MKTHQRSCISRLGRISKRILTDPGGDVCVICVQPYIKYAVQNADGRYDTDDLLRICENFTSGFSLSIFSAARRAFASRSSLAGFF